MGDDGDETDDTSKVALLDYMALRSPSPVSPGTIWRNYIADDHLRAPGEREAGTPDSVFTESEVARRIYQAVFCTGESLLDLRSSLLERIPARQADCGAGPPGAGLRIEDLERHAFYQDGDTYHLMPDTLDALAPPAFMAKVARAQPLLRDAAVADIAGLVSRLETVLDSALIDVVFQNGGESTDLRDAKRSLFDALYLMYVMRRWITVNLEQVIQGLQVIHVLEALAVDQLASAVAAGGSPDQADLLARAAELVPQLREWDGQAAPGLPLVATVADLAAYRTATPIVHPLVSRLFAYRTPFNNLTPIGIGDLKVVKHWLIGYRAGDIAYIENVLKGETRDRIHRRLEKTEDVFTSSSDDSTQTTNDLQTTDRFELKNEVESVVKSDTAVNLGATANFEYTGTSYKITAGLTAGYAYTTSNADTSKLANTFARDVVNKAVSNVQKRTTASRKTTRLFETEETNLHKISNTASDAQHVSGIYRWVDNLYTSQVFNYGKRLMFEFVLPEPAALFVESRLAAYEAALDVPRYPAKESVPGLPDWLTLLQPDHITEAVFRDLALRYDLSGLPYPAPTREVDFVDMATGKNLFHDTALNKDWWDTRTFTCRPAAKGYRISELTIDGLVLFSGRTRRPGEVDGEPEPVAQQDINTLFIWIDGFLCFQHVDNDSERWYFPGGPLNRANPVADAPAFLDDQVDVTLGFWDGLGVALTLHATLELSAEALYDWQQRVYQKVHDVEQAKVDQAEQNAEQSFQAELATYRNRLDDLRALAVNDLIQGQSSDFNQEIVRLELKRQCLSAITREMDADPGDDTWTDQELLGTRIVNSDYHRFDVTQVSAADGQVTTSAQFTIAQQTATKLPVPRLAAARQKGRVVQFLEQAFEWDRLTYLPYPYFWTVPHRWYELLSRSDHVDPFFSAFLRAGSVRVLLAVTPAYNDAVLHYIATGEPWGGGPSPVIGDPLFVPLYEELRGQQDDLSGATADGEPWTFTLPTSLLYLQNSSTPLPGPPGP